MSKPKFIDDDREHIRVLRELGQLDDMDDWEQYREQMIKEDDGIDIDTWLKYVKLSNK